MIQNLLPMLIGSGLDLLIGDPHGFPHPVIWIGSLISFLERKLRRVFPKSPAGEKTAGAFLWLIVTTAAAGLSLLVIILAKRIHPWLGIAVESVMCWQILAMRSLRDESMKVWQALQKNDIPGARQAVSMIVGRDTGRLDDLGITRAAVETVAENTSDGVTAPLLFLAIGGAPAGFFYKAVNTMDSMLGYTDPPYTDLGMVPARADDAVNFLPSRLTALLMLAAGGLQGLDIRNGWKIFRRDRYKHASPNSAQTEAACAGLLRVRLAGDAWYHGVLHKKQYIGDPLREIEYDDIPKTCRLMYGTSFFMLVLCCLIRILIVCTA